MMRVSAKTLTVEQAESIRWDDRAFKNKRSWRFSFLLALVTLSAVSLVYLKAINRGYISLHQALHREQHTLQEQWGRLLLENSALTRQVRIQAVAEDQLNMQVPVTRRVIDLLP